MRLHGWSGGIVKAVRVQTSQLKTSTVKFYLASTVSHRFERKHASVALCGCIACTKEPATWQATEQKLGPRSNIEACVWMWLPGLRQDDFLTRPGRWSRFALLHRHQITDIGEYCFEVRHLSTLGRPNQLKKKKKRLRVVFFLGTQKTMSSTIYEQHKASGCATGPAERTAGLTIDWNGVVVSGYSQFTSPQTTIIGTEKKEIQEEELGDRLLDKIAITRPVRSISL